MNSMTMKMTVVFATLAICILATVWCEASLRTGEMKTERVSVEDDESKSASVKLMLGVGSVNLHGDSANLMDATFSYNLPEWKPEVKYDGNNGVGKLTVTQPKTQGEIKGRAKNKWDISLKNDFPLSLSVETGVGNCVADLERLSVSSLKANMGVGNIKVLAGDCPQLAKLELNSGVGNIEVDLTSRWTKNLNATIGIGTGDIKIHLPRDIGVRVEADKGLGRVNANGFRRQDDAYVNDAYGKSSITLRINASTGVGNITLIQGR